MEEGNHVSASATPSQVMQAQEGKVSVDGETCIVVAEVGGGGRESGIGSSSAGGVNSETVAKRKRGRPRKYCDNTDDDAGNRVCMGSPPPPGFSSPTTMSEMKRGRGRPRGSGKLQLLAALGGAAVETAGGDFIPHVLTVDTGEDVFQKLWTFSRWGPRAVCVLSTTGAISSVILKQPASSVGILRCEGLFEILSLSRTFTFSELGGSNSKIGMLSVSLANSDGRVFGGSVAACLVAAGPIQLIVTSFKQNIGRELKTAKFPPRIVGVTKVEKNCATPTSVLLETMNGETGNAAAINQNPSPGSKMGLAKICCSPRSPFYVKECLQISVLGCPRHESISSPVRNYRDLNNRCSYHSYSTIPMELEMLYI